MPQLHLIHILGIKYDNRGLILDKPNLAAKSGDTIQWIVLGKSGVDSIEGITEKFGINNVWSTRPLGNNNWRGTILNNAPSNYNYKYNIIWEKDGIRYTYDPKIAINPTGGFSDNLLVSFIALVGLTSILFWFNKKRRK